jgi:hypothetical protein
VDVPTPDGCRVLEIAEARSELPESLHDFTSETMAVFNTVAALGALLRDPASGWPVIVSRAPLLAEEEGSLGHYGMLLHAAALSHPEQLVTAFMLAEEGGVRPGVAYPRRPEGEPSPWPAADFEQAAASMRRRGYAVSASATGLEAELDWPSTGEPGGTGPRCPSELVFSTNEPHPLLGDGLRCRLGLPLEFRSKERVIQLINALNLLETQAMDAPPLFGAWCQVPHRNRIAWVSFLPDSLRAPNLVANLAAWTVNRHWFARELISERRI